MVKTIKLLEFRISAFWLNNWQVNLRKKISLYVLSGSFSFKFINMAENINAQLIFKIYFLSPSECSSVVEPEDGGSIDLRYQPWTQSFFNKALVNFAGCEGIGEHVVRPCELAQGKHKDAATLHTGNTWENSSKLTETLKYRENNEPWILYRNDSQESHNTLHDHSKTLIAKFGCCTYSWIVPENSVVS